MNRQFYFLAFMLLAGAFMSCNKPYKNFPNNESDYAIVPAPEWEQQLPGRFPVDENSVIIAQDDLIREAEYLRDLISRELGVEVPIQNSAGHFKNEIELRVEDGEGAPESYELVVIPDKILVKSTAAKGVFWGVQTLRQLFNAPDMARGLEVPTITGVHVKDTPRFAYRGMHLDVARHFQPVSFVKKFIDLLALHKMNTFHWHLTEDQGWRVEIKKYPRLTEIGAWRNGTVVGKAPWTENDNEVHGGFYTQEEIKDVVKYAADRHITIIPEIELPGHSSAAIAAYPELSCFPDKPTTPKRGVLSEKSKAQQQEGSPKVVFEEWGVTDDVYCAGKESTFAFIEGVLEEVVELFPSTYIHIGGDECPKGHWEICEHCQARIKDQGLANEHELQSYFIRRIEQYLNEKGKQIIGWDEILEGGLAPNATVMYWRSWDKNAAVITAVSEGHEVIMSPTSHSYFDYYQADPESEPEAICCMITVEQVYGLEPVPEAIRSMGKEDLIKGAQANIWTEYMKDSDYVEYMALPRMAALAEVVWTSEKKKDYRDFINRLSGMREIYDQLGYTYAPHVFEDTGESK